MGSQNRRLRQRRGWGPKAIKEKKGKYREVAGLEGQEDGMIQKGMDRKNLGLFW